MNNSPTLPLLYIYINIPSCVWQISILPPGCHLRIFNLSLLPLSTTVAGWLGIKRDSGPKMGQIVRSWKTGIFSTFLDILLNMLQTMFNVTTMFFLYFFPSNLGIGFNWLSTNWPSCFFYIYRLMVGWRTLDGRDAGIFSSSYTNHSRSHWAVPWIHLMRSCVSS